MNVTAEAFELGNRDGAFPVTAGLGERGGELGTRSIASAPSRRRVNPPGAKAYFECVSFHVAVLRLPGGAPCRPKRNGRRVARPAANACLSSPCRHG